jgi:hypothetical protein
MNPVHNTRVQLLANALNTIAVALIVTAAVVPAINGKVPPYYFVWVAGGAFLHIIAQTVLGKLKP